MKVLLKNATRNGFRGSITTEGWVLPPQRVWLSLWFSERVLLWWGFFVFSPGDAFNRQLNALQEFSDPMNVMAVRVPRQAVHHHFWFWNDVSFRNVRALTELATGYHGLGWPNPDPGTCRMFSSEWGKTKQTEKPLWPVTDSCWCMAEANKIL